MVADDHRPLAASDRQSPGQLGTPENANQQIEDYEEERLDGRQQASAEPGDRSGRQGQTDRAECENRKGVRGGGKKHKKPFLYRRTLDRDPLNRPSLAAADNML